MMSPISYLYQRQNDDFVKKLHEGVRMLGVNLLLKIIGVQTQIMA